MKIAVYPGSFDPVTNGHIDVIERALRIFDKIIIAVGDNPQKKALFTVDERSDMLDELTKKYKQSDGVPEEERVDDTPKEVKK